MKKQDIKPGVVYAYQRSREYGTPEPVVFLVAPSEGKLYATTSDYRKPGRPAFIEAHSGAKPHKGTGFSGTDYGYPVAKLRSGNMEPAAQVADLLKPTLADFEKCATAYAPAGFDGLEFSLATTLTHITGEYETELAAHKARCEAERAASQRERAERDAARDRAAAILGRLDELGGIDAEAVSEPRRPYGYVRISVDDAEKLVELLTPLRDARVTGTANRAITDSLRGARQEEGQQQ